MYQTWTKQPCCWPTCTFIIVFVLASFSINWVFTDLCWLIQVWAGSGWFQTQLCWSKCLPAFWNVLDSLLKPIGHGWTGSHGALFLLIPVICSLFFCGSCASFSVLLGGLWCSVWYFLWVPSNWLWLNMFPLWRWGLSSWVSLHLTVSIGNKALPAVAYSVCLVRCCHSHLQALSMLGFCVCQYRRWMRKKEH